jgi:hypothetical protein
MNALIKILLVFFMVLAPLVSFSQGDRDKVELLRTAFITKKLELSGAESDRFWPVYNEYNDKIKAIRKNLRQSYRKKTEPLSEADAEELYQLDLMSKQAEADVHRQYGEKIKNIIGVKRYVRLRVAEEEFKREMINSIKEKND